MKANTYFEEVERTLSVWEAAKKDRETRKEYIIKTFGWDSQEFKDWKAEDAEAQYPLTRGECDAYRAWRTSNLRGNDELELDDSVWEKDIHDFIETLRKAGIESFVITSQSTGLMGNLHGFAAEGCEMTGLCTITRKEARWGEEEPEKVK